MKILHTSDWHLGKKLEKFSRHEEQVEVLDEIADIANSQNIDLVLIAGDVFDSFNPPVESIELFYRTIKRLSKHGARSVIVIAGNHDSPDRIEAPDALALEDAIIFAGSPYAKIRKFKNEAGVELTQSENGFIELKLPEFSYPVRIILAPYANQFRIKKFLGIENDEAELRNVLEDYWGKMASKYCDRKGVNLFCGHFFFTSKANNQLIESDDEKSILHVGGAQEIYNTNLPEQLQYVALGHLHRKQLVSEEPCQIKYSGSPLSYSFSEASQTKYVEIVNIEPNSDVLSESVELTKGKKLLRKRFSDIEQAIFWLKENPNALIELTIESDNYLLAEDRKKLNDSHPNIISIIPELKSNREKESSESKIDLSRSMKELFVDYFKFRHQQEPSTDVLSLFDEVMSEEPNSEN